MKQSRLRIAVFLCLLVAPREPAAAELHVMTSGAFEAAHRELSARFEKQTRHGISTTRAPSIGPGSIPAKLAAGARADVIILARDAIDELIASGLVQSGERTDLVRSVLGAAVKAGSARPDLGTVASFRQALLDAKSVAYSSSVSGAYFARELLPRLGISAQVLPKCVVAGRVSVPLLTGEAELGIQQVSELVGIDGIDYVGPLPRELQRITIFSAAIPVSSENPALARAFIAFLASPAAADVIRRCGLDPIPAPRTASEPSRAGK